MALPASCALSVFAIQWWKCLWEGGGALAGEHIPRPTGRSGRLSCALHKWFILTQSVFLRWEMTITGYGQVSLEKQRKGRVNGTIGVRRERGIREKVHDEMGIKKKKQLEGRARRWFPTLQELVFLFPWSSPFTFKRKGVFLHCINTLEVLHCIRHFENRWCRSLSP